MNDKKRTRRLVLKKETIRSLQPHELRQAAGATGLTWSCICTITTTTTTDARAE